MPRLIFARSAQFDLVRLRGHYVNAPEAAKNAARAIRTQLQVLTHQPGVGRPLEDMPPEFRELIIDFGDSGYVARYHLAPDLVTVVKIRHQRELDYQGAE